MIANPNTIRITGVVVQIESDDRQQRTTAIWDVRTGQWTIDGQILGKHMKVLSELNAAIRAIDRYKNEKPADDKAGLFVPSPEEALR